MVLMIHLQINQENLLLRFHFFLFLLTKLGQHGKIAKCVAFGGLGTIEASNFLIKMSLLSNLL